MKTFCTCLSGKTKCDCQNLELIVTDRTDLNNRKDMTKEESKHHLELYEQLQSENERLIKEIEDRVVKCILDDIDFGYDLATIKGKIKSGSYVGNSPETFTENKRLKSELLGNPEQLKAEREWISVETKFPELDRSVWVFAEGEVWPAYYWDFCGRLTFHSQDTELKPTHWMYNDAPQPPKQ